MSAREVLQAVRLPMEIVDGDDGRKVVLYGEIGPNGIAAILSALDAAGYAVVPTIPTDKMVIAGGEAQSRSTGSWGEPKLVWKNMIDAAKLSETKQRETP